MSTYLSVLPAEWAPQHAILLTWPQPDGDFARIFPAVERNFVALACAIARFEPLIISHASSPDGLRRRLIEAGVPAARLSIFRCDSDDVWARDHGPITVLRGGRAVMLDFTFNGWGGKFDATHDNRLTAALHAAGAFPGYELERIDFVLEGGAIEVDGAGTMLTTERCLLAPTRNANLTRERIESYLKSLFGLQRVFWLRHGDLLGDDTDGHIDTLARFCDERTIAYQACDRTDDPHFEDLASMAEELRALRTVDGERYRLVWRIPPPHPWAVPCTRTFTTPTVGARLPPKPPAIPAMTNWHCTAVAAPRLNTALAVTIRVRWMPTVAITWI